MKCTVTIHTKWLPVETTPTVELLIALTSWTKHWIQGLCAPTAWPCCSTAGYGAWITAWVSCPSPPAARHVKLGVLLSARGVRKPSDRLGSLWRTETLQGEMFGLNHLASPSARQRDWCTPRGAAGAHPGAGGCRCLPRSRIAQPACPNPPARWGGSRASGTNGAPGHGSIKCQDAPGLLLLPHFDRDQCLQKMFLIGDCTPLSRKK